MNLYFRLPPQINLHSSHMSHTAAVAATVSGTDNAGKADDALSLPDFLTGVDCLLYEMKDVSEGKDLQYMIPIFSQ